MELIFPDSVGWRHDQSTKVYLTTYSDLTLNLESTKLQALSKPVEATQRKNSQERFNCKGPSFPWPHTITVVIRVCCNVRVIRCEGQCISE